jgi:hypothetical protein
VRSTRKKRRDQTIPELRNLSAIFVIIESFSTGETIGVTKINTEKRTGEIEISLRSEGLSAWMILQRSD